MSIFESSGPNATQATPSLFDAMVSPVVTPVPAPVTAEASAPAAPVPPQAPSSPVAVAPASPVAPAPVPSLASMASSVGPLTAEQLKVALPDKLKKSINQELVDQINATLADPMMFEQYRDNLLSYTRVMADGRFKITDYVHAVKYVSHKLMGSTNLEAYTKTFPDKYALFIAQGVSAKDIASYVSAYNKGKLVNLIFEQTLIPAHVLNQDLYQKALNVQADLMMNAKSEKVRCEAANSILGQLKTPEVKKIEMDIGVKEDSSINALRQATLELAAQQRMLIQSGAKTAQDIAHSRVIDVDAKEV